jgi:fructuronate reductase
MCRLEEMKLRMLNGSHSFLAYLGCLAGYAHISDCMQDAGLVMLVRHLMVQEQAVTLERCPDDPKSMQRSCWHVFAIPLYCTVPCR